MGARKFGLPNGDRISISIAMATHNGASYLREQLESLSKQTVLPDELVVCDDGSSDETSSIFADFASTAPFPVRVEQNLHPLGYRANFLKVANLAKSDLIAFCDQDDIWLPSKLAACLGLFNEHKEVLLAYHNASVVTGTLEPIGSLKDRKPPHRFNRPQSIDPWRYGLGFTMVFRRILLDFSDLWPESAHSFAIDQPEAHDQWFYFLASSLGTIAYIKEPLALYRQHGKNLFGWNDKPSFRRRIDKIRMPTARGLNTRALMARKRAAILDQIAGRGGEYRSRAASAAVGYRKLEQNLRGRQEIYLATKTVSKVSCLVVAVVSGAYRSPRHWGTGLESILSDILQVIHP